ncbi:hypothetical protein GCM10009839_35990 [Catenulispora yoronensis]|uniref:Uncharacterized protein n=2 Tax=Catenulispora yoronensis TaxID=450799 RepID=A0ABP5FVK0_9ACTN
MNTRGLSRQRLIRPAHRPGTATDGGEVQRDRTAKQYPKKISATAETGDPTRSFQMLFQYEEAARYRSQELRDEAERVRFAKEASRLRRQGERGARRARRGLAGLFLN